MNDIRIIFVLDKSGSMQAVADDTIGGFNAFKRAQAAEPGRTTLSLTLFDSTAHAAHPPIPVDEVSDLTQSTYVPGGQTALYDAVGSAIESAQTAPENRKTLVAVLTDGAENASRRYSRASLAALVAAKKQSGWEFLYLGAAPENWADAAALGMTPEKFAPSPGGTAAAYATVTAHATRLRDS